MNSDSEKNLNSKTEAEWGKRNVDIYNAAEQ